MLCRCPMRNKIGKHQTWNQFSVVVAVAHTYARRYRTSDNVIRIDRHLILISAYVDLMMKMMIVQCLYFTSALNHNVEAKAYCVTELIADGSLNAQYFYPPLEKSEKKKRTELYLCNELQYLRHKSLALCNDFWLVARVFSLSANKHDYMPCSQHVRFDASHNQRVCVSVCVLVLTI